MTRRTAAALTALLAVPLAACGVRGSEVVEAGGAATVAVQPLPESRAVLYFRGPDGRLMPVARALVRPDENGDLPQGESGGPAVPFHDFGPDYEASRKDPGGTRMVADKILAALLAGPGPEETRAGLTTALPRGDASLRVEPVTSGTAREGRAPYRLRASFAVTGLPAGALDQLVCTAAFALDAGGRADVTVTGPDGSLPARTCEG
ncbi:hypothetical protein [Streptomyces sp. NPDC053755]|uniref:hypothetical protein n=1 Tax=Streptomyces sp. NPDC053755 TaxID=3155815 RepID=UPI003446EFD0